MRNTGIRTWVSVLAASAISMAEWRIFYSKQCFREAWLFGNRILQAKIDAQVESGLGSTIVMTALTYVVFSLGIHYFLDATNSRTFWRAMGNTFVLWFLIVVPLVYMDLLWEFRKLDLFVLDSAHFLLVFLSVTVVYHWFINLPAKRS